MKRLAKEDHQIYSFYASYKFKCMHNVVVLGIRLCYVCEFCGCNESKRKVKWNCG